MIQYNKLTALSKAIHRQQVEAGWYKLDRSDELLVFLVKSEVFECFEAWRKKKVFNAASRVDKVTNNGFLEYLDLLNEDTFKKVFESVVKDTVQDELADVVIRLMDYAGYKDVDLDKALVPSAYESTSGINPFVQLDGVLSSFMLCPNGAIAEFVMACICIINNYCIENRYNISRHIELKLEYNRLRSNRHGGKIA